MSSTVRDDFLCLWSFVDFTEYQTNPNRLVYSQKQEYTFRLIGHVKVMESIVVVELDANNKITYLADKWDGNEIASATFLRRCNAKVTLFSHLTVTCPSNALHSLYHGLSGYPSCKETADLDLEHSKQPVLPYAFFFDIIHESCFVSL